jgi:primosomal protein N''
MKDYRAHLETLRQQAAESALISALTTVPHKRELFAKHAEHLNALADEVERAMAAANEPSDGDTVPLIPSAI